jgi:hypothetical protein
MCVILSAYILQIMGIKYDIDKKNLSKNAIHNPGYNIAISAHFYKMNYSYNVHLHTWTSHKCSKLILLSTSAFPGKGLKNVFSFCPCYVGPCHHGMARPQVADGGTASSYGG